MLHSQNLEKLYAMRLHGMAQALEEQRRQSDIAELDFETRLGLLIERQWVWKENRGLDTRREYAQFKVLATIEDIDYRHPRGLKRAQIDQLRSSQWILEGRNCIITGATGCGKTYLACALGHQGCRNGQRILYYYAPKLFRALSTAQADGSLLSLHKKLRKAALLIIDDLGIASVSGQQYRDLLEIIDDRHGQGSILITSQFPIKQWHDLMGDATVADAIVDRLLHNAYRIDLTGKSMRGPQDPGPSNPDPSDS